MIVRETTNRAEVLAYKKRKALIENKHSIGLIPVGNRPKPVYILKEMTVEQYHAKCFDLYCDKLEASS